MKRNKTAKACDDPDINGLRERIDIIDDELLKLVNRRLALAQRIGAVKQQAGMPVVDRQREGRIFDRLLARNSGPLGTWDLHRIFGDLMAAARRVQPDGVPGAPTTLYAVFGNPVAHSLSPLMHTTAFLHSGLDSIYLPFRIFDIAEAVRAVRALDIRGVSITLPYKVSVMAHLDKLDDMAQRIGAVNTIVNREGILCGYNSDWQGAVLALAEKTVIRGRQVAVIGAGGAARAVAFGIKKEGGRVTILNRSRQKGEKLAADLNADFIPLPEVRKLKCEILINTTPVGMTPGEDAVPIAQSALRREMVVMDVVYNPLQTRLLATAGALGCVTVDGLAMFVHQGAVQFELWTGLDAPLEIMRRAVRELLLEKGKTT